jgi:hypothetical protein
VDYRRPGVSPDCELAMMLRLTTAALMVALVFWITRDRKS